MERGQVVDVAVDDDVQVVWLVVRRNVAYGKCFRHGDGIQEMAGLEETKGKEKGGGKGSKEKGTSDRGNVKELHRLSESLSSLRRQSHALPLYEYYRIQRPVPVYE